MKRIVFCGAQVNVALGVYDSETGDVVPIQTGPLQVGKCADMALLPRAVKEQIAALQTNLDEAEAKRIAEQTIELVGPDGD